MRIGLAIKITGSEVVNEYPIGVYVRPQREFIKYRQAVQPRDVQIAYLESEKIYSHEAIQVVDHIKQYSKAVNPSIAMTKNNQIISNRENLIFTTITNNSNGNRIPRFYGHPLSVQADQINFIPWNKDFENTYEYHPEYKLITSDIDNEINAQEEVFNPSFVQYRCLENTVYLKAGEVKSEIYRKEPISRLASIEDIDIETLEYKKDRILFEKEILPNGLYKYTVFGQSNPEQIIYYKENLPSKVRVEIDKNLTTESNWPLRIYGNKLTVKKNETDSYAYTYAWENPNESVYYPAYGYREHKVKANVFNENSILLPYKNMVLDYNKNIHLTFKVIRNGKVIAARTTQPSLINKKISGNAIDQNIIKYIQWNGSYDPVNAIITTGDCNSLDLTDQIIVEYYSYNNEGIKMIDDLNPLHKRGLEENSYFYFATPKVGATYSQIHFVELNRMYDPYTGDYSLYILNSSSSDYSEYIGEKFSIFANDVLLYNPYSFYSTESSNTTSTCLPIATVSFNKQKYIDSVNPKDLRIYSGLKKDLELERKGNDFAFSQILNSNHFYNRNLEGQCVVLYDESEIPNYLTTDFESTIQRSIGVGLVPHLMKKGHPIITKAECYVDDSDWDNIILAVTTKKAMDSLNLNKLKVYYTPTADYNQNNVYLLGEEESIATYPNENLKFEFTISPGDANFNLNSSVKDQIETKKIYVYFTWGSSELLAYESGRSSIYCINIKE